MTSSTAVLHRVGVAIGFLLMVSSCGSESVVSGGVAAEALACGESLDEIVTLLQSGLPTYDYEPAVDLADLLGQTDVAVTGSISSIVRQTLETGSDGRVSWTVASVENVETLHSPADPAVAISELSLWSLWPTGGDPDPIAEPVRVTGVEFVAFLNESEGAPGGYAVLVQGLAVGCAGEEVGATWVIESLPDDSAGLSISALTEAVIATSDELP